jgi:hypothetical protein
MSHLIQKRISTVPMPAEFKSKTSPSTQASIKTQTNTQTSYVPNKTKTQIGMSSVIVENPYIKVESPHVVATTQLVMLPVTLPSREIGFVPFGVVQVSNPVHCIVSRGPTVTLPKSSSELQAFSPLTRIVPNLVRF